MKLAIHYREGSFSDRWIDYCIINNLSYIKVNCHDSNIISILKNEKITHLMWHLSHSSSTDIMVSPYVLNSADSLGIKTFPNFETRWHFDDKIAQKYLFESNEAPFINSHVFYAEETGLEFLKKASFPVVAKLKRGAGATNVKLIHNFDEGKNYTQKLFGEGIISTSKAMGNLDQKVRIAKNIKNFPHLVKKVIYHFKRTIKERKMAPAEKGYVYFQEFMPNNDFDTRIIVIGDKAFGIRRFNRDNDFRASGSGKIDYTVSSIDINFVSIALSLTSKMGAQCLAYDFVYGANAQPKIIEACFAFSMLAYDKCEGYWDKDLNFTPGVFNPQFFMVEDFIAK